MRITVIKAWVPLFTAVMVLAGVFVFASRWSNARTGGDPSKLCVVWTSADKDVAMKMVYMYTLNAKKQGWFDRVRFVVWGPSSKLLSEDADLQAFLAQMKEAGVELTACVVCADMYGVSDKLRGLGIDVKGMGRPLTEMLKSDWKVMTF